MDKKSVLGPWKQGLYGTSVDATEIVGTLREDVWGNRYHYAKAGAAGLGAGKLTTAAAEDADWVSEAASSYAVGAKTLVLTITDPGTSGVNAENYFAGGHIAMTDGTAEGIRYPILYSSAVASGGTSITITLDQALVEAITSGTEFTLVHSPYMAAVISAAITDVPNGVPLVDVTAAYYYWSQTGGLANVLGGDTAAIGTMAALSTTDGASAAAISYTAGAITTGTIGIFVETNVSGEYVAVRLSID